MLAAPFPPELVRQRPGSGRNTFDYVSGAEVIKRVLNATGGRFTWSVTSIQMVQEQSGHGCWLVRGTLTIPDLGCRDGIGTHPAEGVDAAKAAETDAFKRAALKFGVALSIYLEEQPVEPHEAIRGPELGPMREAPTERQRALARMAFDSSRVASPPIAVRPCPICHAPEGKPHTARCPQTRRAALA
jgi:hypothetical protein